VVVLCGDYTLAVVSLWFSQVCTNGLVKSLGVGSDNLWDIRFIGMKLSSVLGYFVLAFSKRIAILISFRGKW
jgi:hypothetical protein